MNNDPSSPNDPSHIQESCMALSQDMRKLLCVFAYEVFNDWPDQRIPVELFNSFRDHLDSLRHIKNNGYDEQKYKDIIHFWKLTVTFIPQNTIEAHDPNEISVLEPSYHINTFLQDVRDKVSDLIEHVLLEQL